MIRSDAWDGKTGAHALTLKVELMHEAEKQRRQHHFLPLSRPAPAHVGAAPPAKPYPTVGPRQQGALNPARRRPLLAPPRRQSLDSPPGHANRACSSPEGPLFPGGLPSLSPDGRRPQAAGPRLPRRPLPAALPPPPVQIEICRESGHKKRKISPFWQLQSKIKIVSIKKTRTIRWKY